MGKSSRLEYLQLGLHDANDWTTTPADMHYVERAGGNVVTDFEDIPRDYDRGDGQPLSELNGFSIGDLEGLALDLHGLSGSGAGTSVSSATLGSQITDMLFTSMMGAAPADYTGDETAAAPGAGATVSLFDGAGLSAGAAVLMKGGTSDLLQARWIESKDASDVTLCRALTTDLGVAEDAKASEAVYAGRVWDMDFDNDDHRHLAVQGTIKSFRRRLIKGALGNPRITYPRGVAARYEVTLNGSEWSDPGDATVPAFGAGPTQGNPIRCIHCPLWLGDTLYMAVLDALDPGLVLEARESDNAAQSGKYGFVVVSKAPTLTFRISFGSLTAPSEMNDALLQAAQGSQTALKTTYDLLWQTGRSAGQAKASRFRAASLRVREVTQGSQRAVQVTARATRPTSGSPFSIALF